MRFIAWLLVVPIFLVEASARAAPKDIAELFPADSLAYVEINQPGAVAKDLAAFLKGTAFAKSEPLLDRLFRKKTATVPINVSDSGILITLLGPAMLKEAARFQGIAAALTGFDKNGDPEYVAAVLTGDSKLPGSVMASYLAAHPEVRKIATVEGFDLYQQRQPNIAADFGGPQPVQPMKYFGPLYAYQPGIVLTGSSKENLSAAIRRWKNTEKLESLFTKSAFKEIAKQRERAGILLFADARTLLERLHAANRNRDELEPFASVLLRRLIPPASARVLTGRLDFKEQSITARFALKLDPKGSSPLAELMTGPVLAATDLSILGKDTPLALTFNLPSGERRLPSLLMVLDTFSKATGTLGPTASEIAKEMEEKKILSNTVLAKINRVTVLMPPLATWPKGGMPTPSVLVRADPDDALEKIEAAIPAILEILGGSKSDPVTESIDGIKVRSLEAKASPLGRPIHYARDGKALCIGHDRLFLATSLRTDATTGAALTGIDKASAVGVWNWVDHFRPPTPEKQTTSGIPRQRAAETIIAEAPSYGRRSEMRGGSRLPPRELLNNLRGLPSMVVTLGREGDELWLEVKQADPHGLRTQAIDRWLEWYARTSPRSGNRGGMIYDGPIDIIAPPPAPPAPLAVPNAP